jgi:hypothetical protein
MPLVDGGSGSGPKQTSAEEYIHTLKVETRLLHREHAILGAEQREEEKAKRARAEAEREGQLEQQVFILINLFLVQ